MKKKKVERVQVRSFNETTNFFSNTMIALFVISRALPFIFVIATSVTDESVLSVHGYSLWPEKFSLSGYTYLFDQTQDKIFQAFYVIMLITVLGTLINSTATSSYAYAISWSNFPFRRLSTVFCSIMMLFSPGMVANYLVTINLLQLKDMIWISILSTVVSPFNIIVMRTFFRHSVSDPIAESARIDGVSEFRMFIQIVLPLAVPGIATISSFVVLGYWNDWFNALLYIQDDKLVPLQYLLTKTQSNIQYLTQSSGAGS